VFPPCKFWLAFNKLILHLSQTFPSCVKIPDFPRISISSLVDFITGYFWSVIKHNQEEIISTKLQHLVDIYQNEFFGAHYENHSLITLAFGIVGIDPEPTKRNINTRIRYNEGRYVSAHLYSWIILIPSDRERVVILGSGCVCSLVNFLSLLIIPPAGLVSLYQENWTRRNFSQLLCHHDLILFLLLY